LVYAVAFYLGAVIGSFLNVCIHRIPLKLSVVSPPSRCPHCETLIRWYQNVPIISWLVLGGKCAKCKKPISARYPLVEALNGLLYALVIYYFSLSEASMVYMVFLSLLVIITFIDIDHQIIPNVISLPGILVGIAGSFFVPWLSLIDSVLGALAGALLLGGIAFGYRLLTGKEGMGMGDLKLLAMIGAFLGWQSILPIVFIASLAGTIIGVPLMLSKGANSKLALPFGPFLSLAAAVYLFWWFDIFSWYQSLFF
jgi:leader peptidase (prepilin peptidase)/N-methyltransferase